MHVVHVMGIFSYFMHIFMYSSKLPQSLVTAVVVATWYLPEALFLFYFTIFSWFALIITILLSYVVRWMSGNINTEKDNVRQ